jgi:hypothetical protein
VPLVEGSAAGELADVGSGDERLLAGAGEDDDPYRVVGLDAGEDLQHLVAHLLVQGVELVRSVDRQDGDAAFAFHQDGFGHEDLLGKFNSIGTTLYKAAGARRGLASCPALPHRATETSPRGRFAPEEQRFGSPVRKRRAGRVAA